MPKRKRKRSLGRGPVPRRRPPRDLAIYEHKPSGDFVAINPDHVGVVRRKRKACRVPGWRGPKYRVERFRCSDLVGPKNCGALLVDMGGRWECMPSGVKIF